MANSFMFDHAGVHPQVRFVVHKILFLSDPKMAMTPNSHNQPESPLGSGIINSSGTSG